MDRKLPVLSSSCVCVCVCVCVRVSSWITVILKHTWMLLRINSTNWLKTHAGEKLTLLQYTHTHGKWTQTARKQWNTRTEPRDHGVILQSHTHTHTHTVVQVKVAAGVSDDESLWVSVWEHVLLCCDSDTLQVWLVRGQLQEVCVRWRHSTLRPLGCGTGGAS